jgi:hypothetical protein
MIIEPYTVNDFSIGETVVPIGLGSLALVIVDIDRKAGKVICRLSHDSEKIEHVFSPGELEKDPYVHPPNIVEIKISQVKRRPRNTSTN